MHVIVDNISMPERYGLAGLFGLFVVKYIQWIFVFRR